MEIIWSQPFEADIKYYFITIYSKKDDNRIPSDAQIVELINNLL